MQNVASREGVVWEFVATALECTVYLSPLDFGLTIDELVEAGGRHQFLAGEIRDLVSKQGPRLHAYEPRLRPPPPPDWGDFFSRFDDDPRTFEAFEFVRSDLREIARREGIKDACIDRAVLVARGEAKGLRALDVQAAVSICALSGILIADETTVRLPEGRRNYPLPSEQLQQARGVGPSTLVARIAIRKACAPTVADVIRRRTGAVAPTIEPLKAFSYRIGELGFDRLRAWWSQTLGELERLDPTLNPVGVAVMSAALMEAALIMVVQRARALKVAFGSNEYDRPLDKWRLEDLVKSAATGTKDSVLSQALRTRADGVVVFRQRIHAGRMVVDSTGPIPDLRPEEAREARRSVELVVRRISEWLDEHPKSGQQ